MSEIILEEKFDKDGNYLGKIVAYLEDLTPEFIAELKADKDNVHGWKKHHAIMQEHGYDLEAVQIE